MNLKKRLLVGACCVLGTMPVLGATLSVSPNSAGDAYTGNITLTISGLNSGETVVVQRFLDANGNGSVDSQDWLVEQFQLTDGQSATVGGIVNLNIPADSDSIAGTITAKLGFQAGGLEQRFAGKYLFQVSSPTSRFAPVTQILTVTNSASGQSLSGTVQADGTNVADVAVLLFAGGISGSSFAAAAVGNSSGAYTVKPPAGTYVPIPFKPGLVTDTGASPPISLPAGANLTTNLDLLLPTRAISGKFVDAATPAKGLGGVLVICQSVDGLMAIGFTDTNGNFNIPVTASQWQVGWESSVLPILGYVDLLNQPSADTTAGNVSGLTVSFPKGTALLYGSLKDEQNHPISGVTLFADDFANTYEGLGSTDATGNYSVAVPSGSWFLGVDTSSPALANYIVSEGTNAILNSGQTLQHDFTALRATNYVSGFVFDTTNHPVAGVGVNGLATIAGTTYSQYVVTDDTGAFRFNVAPGTWLVGLNCSGSSEALSPLGYQCVPDISLTVAGVNVATNFIVSPCGSLTVTSPSPLVAGRVGFYYEVILQAIGCYEPFSWGPAPGSALPPGLNLGSDGIVSGYPTASGTFSFTVRVSDNNATHVDKSFSVAIAPPQLQVVTSTLPTGGVGLPYSQQLGATGGQTPYSWSVPSSSVAPPGLTLSAGGLLSGIPTVGATFYFDVVATDALGTNASGTIALVVTNQPLLLTTTSLPDASVGSPYNAQLAASGGQPPYSFDVVPGSGILPSGLDVTGDGVISGTPDTPQQADFTAIVTDANSLTATRPLSILVTAGVTLGSPRVLANGDFQVQVYGSPGEVYTVESSKDLKTWSPGSTASSTTGTFPLNLGPATNGWRFYRVKVGP
jgi:hypothetical protein